MASQAGDNTLARFTGLTLDPTPNVSIDQARPAFDVDKANDTAEFDGPNSSEKVQADDGSPVLTLRSLVSTKEAGVVIGKAGKNVAEVRELTGVKAGVSKVIQGVHERILTISGSLESVAKAYSLVSKHILENSLAQNTGNSQPSNTTTVKLLVSHQLMGSIIGKAGAKIKEIQETSGAKIVISKEMLSQSTERVIEVFGLVDCIQIAVHHIGECILNDIDRAAGTILYNPQVRLGGGVASLTSRNGRNELDSNRPRDHRRTTSTGNPLTDSQNERSYNAPRRYPSNGHSRGDSGNQTTTTTNEEMETQTLNIPADMVGCIIGKGGNFINHIRRSSQSRVSISKELDVATNQRVFTVVGTHDSNEKALDMLYTQLESEKQRRLAIGNSKNAQ
ncbi:RNA binding protein, heterogenous nuclear RNP-K like protein [Nowakowskiella sp. JEL0078]|nr:RNA binding protein, heterogenous nuclear RNP-K like protein [Nowakowskiella sp. JEL0078]